MLRGSGGEICHRRQMRKEGAGQITAHGGEPGFDDTGVTHHTPAGGYLIWGRKVGGDGGVRGVRLGNKDLSIHLEGGEEGDIITKCQ